MVGRWVLLGLTWAEAVQLLVNRTLILVRTVDTLDAEFEGFVCSTRPVIYVMWCVPSNITRVDGANFSHTVLSLCM